MENIDVCFISEAVGGISVYTDYLMKALANNFSITPFGIWLTSSPDEIVPKIENFPSFRKFILEIPSLDQSKDKLINFIENLPCQIVHIQWERSFFPSNEIFLDFLIHINKSTSKKIIVTFHSIYLDPIFIKMVRKCAEFIDTIIVHQENAKYFLVSHGLDPKKIITIPHGTPSINSAPKKNRFFKTNLFKILMVGILKKNKGFDKALSSLKSDKTLEIIVSGWLRDQNESEFVQELCSIQDKSSATISILPQYLKLEDLIALITEADCIVLPYEQDYYSSSGILHLVASLHKPMLVSASPKFKELVEIAPFSMVDDNNYLTHIKELQGVQFKMEFTKKIIKFAEKTSWNVTARKTYNLYQQN
ncbi:MAG: hypothetical protein HeimC3_08000 [Candidatus Heimdallarchaeota archaeon LC_3]|nr:MAG: hypothetical protein HeimC3_08000 [Candidatus Heimdallarchaeota archaeon LC_3]